MLINAAGATFPYPIYSKWFDVYHTKNPNIQINYAVDGFRRAASARLLNGTVDFGASDGPMTDEQIEEFKTGAENQTSAFPDGSRAPTCPRTTFPASTRN